MAGGRAGGARLEAVHEEAEGVLLVHEGCNAHLLHLLQEGGEGGVPGHGRAQHHGVDQVAHRGLQLGAIAAGHGRADEDVFLARVAVQQHGEAGHQQLEQRHALRLGLRTE
jgi:hypothetical protein